jgi:hypothetical protein
MIWDFQGQESEAEWEGLSDEAESYAGLSGSLFC